MIRCRAARDSLLHLARKLSKAESVFLHAQFRAADVASSITPTNAKDAAAQLMFAVLLWKEETGTPTTPCQIAMDKMLGHVVDFLQNT
ncbi:MAG: hypothetical protein ABL857_01390 [Rickettsiales bacterium]|jgi:hypothetical protein